MASPLLGQPPISENDKLIYKGILETEPKFFKALQILPRSDSPSKSPSLVAGSLIGIAVVILITSARLWARTAHRRALGPDDAVIIPAAISCVAYLSADIASETAGCVGKHLWNCTYEEFGLFWKIAHSIFPVFYFTVFMTKISIVLQNRRITGISSKKWQIAHWTYFTMLVLIMIICIFLNIFPCHPIAVSFSFQALAKVEDPKTIKCLNADAISLATRYLHIITDWLLLPVPLIIIWRLQMPLAKRLRLMFVFCIGLMSSIASIIRNVLSQRTNADLTYDYYAVYAWDVVDVTFAVSVASLPALNGLFEEGISKLSQWSSHSGSSLISKLRGSGSSTNASQKGHTDYNQEGWHKAHSNHSGSNGKNSSSNFENHPVPNGSDIELRRGDNDFPTREFV